MSHISPVQHHRRIAVIGSGAAALAAAWQLSRRHEVVIFEKNGHVGGHANTVDVPLTNGGTTAVDTGFIVYNQRTYPNLIRMFEQLRVPTQPTDMSFGVSLDDGATEYSGGRLGGLFGQPTNLLRPRFLGMIADILRFYRLAPGLLDAGNAGLSLGDYLTRQRFGNAFIQDHLLPMAAAIWSAPAETMLDFPAASFVRFCTNHGLLQLFDRPQWRTVVGGSREYVRRLIADMTARIHLNSAVARIERRKDGVEIVSGQGDRQLFDAVVIGTHADEALSLLANPTADESRLLGAFRYQENLALLHGDARLMPRRRRVWSAWNYMGRPGDDGMRKLCVTYWMNQLQSLDPKTPLFVTLNPILPAEEKSVHARFVYHHPVFDSAAMTAQNELDLIQGQNRTWFCGSYFGYGFHEDAFSSGLSVADALGCSPKWGTEPARRPGNRVFP
jgi:predicted NAD/FAD-binding protein